MAARENAATFVSGTLAANHRTALDHQERQGPCRPHGRKLAEGEPVWEIEWEPNQYVLRLRAVGTMGRDVLRPSPTFSLCSSSRTPVGVVTWLSLGPGPALGWASYTSLESPSKTAPEGRVWGSSGKRVSVVFAGLL